MIYYFSQLFVHGEFIYSLSPLEIGSIFSIRDTGLHGSVLLASNNAGEAYWEHSQTSKMVLFLKIVNG